MTEPTELPPTPDPPPRYIRIRHEDGREYAVLETHATTVPVTPDGETYQDLGFVPYAYDGGEPIAAAAPPPP